MEYDTKDEIQELRNSRHTANAIFMRFVEDKDKFSLYAFCFFEGEDGKYYNSRIKKYFGDKFLSYIVGNKKEVIKLMKKIESDSLYNKVIKMFFVDNDFDERLGDEYPNLYETPCYSIENLYAQKEVFQAIIQAEFGINQAHSDYQKCMTDFENRFEEFMKGMEEFNALAMLRRKKSDSNSNVKLSEIKTTHLFDISIYKIVRSDKYYENINKIKLQLDIEDIELENCIIEIRKMENKRDKFRGKNQLDFFCGIINQLKDLNNNKMDYFSEKHDCVKLNITKNRLSELSQYAITPESLNVFLHNHSQLLIA